MSLLVQNFRKEVSKCKDYKMKVETEQDISYPTGFLNFDFLNGTVIHSKISDGEIRKYYSIGIVDGSMNMFIGRAGCGKTTYTVQTAANIVRSYPASAIFHDNIEGGVSTSRLYTLTGFTSDELLEKYVSRNTGITAENFFERVKMISDIKLNDRESFEYDTGITDNYGNRIYKLQPTVYILDSLAMLMPEKYTEEDELSGQMSATAAAKTNAGIFKRIIPLLKSSNIILFIINHINQAVAITPAQRKKAQVSFLKADESLPGGNTPIYLSNNIFRFDDNTKLKETETFGIDGNYVDITMVKSRTNKAGKSTTLVFNQQTGFDVELSLFIMLKQENLVNGAGAYLYIGDRNDKKFSQKQFKNKLKEDIEFKQIFMEAVIDVLKSKLDSSYVADVYDKEQDISMEMLDKINAVA